MSGMRAANCAITSATSVCPTPTMTHSQIPMGPEFRRSKHLEAGPRVRFSSWRDPRERANFSRPARNEALPLYFSFFARMGDPQIRTYTMKL